MPPAERGTTAPWTRGQGRGRGRGRSRGWGRGNPPLQAQQTQQQPSGWRTQPEHQHQHQLIQSQPQQQQQQHQSHSQQNQYQYQNPPRQNQSQHQTQPKPNPEPKPGPQHRVYEPGQRHMELIASVSRSSGLEKDGDALRDPKIQEDYRAFIQDKVDVYWKKYPLRSHRERGVPGQEADTNVDRNRKEMQENLLILFRKLREGLLSTKRRDAFALEVYETSLHLSVLFESPVQTTSTLSHLFPDLYLDIRPSPDPASSRAHSGTRHPSQDYRPETPPPGESPRSVPHNARASTLILLLHHLAQSHPSQIAFHTQLRQLHPALQDVLRAPPLPSLSRPHPSLPPRAHPNSDPPVLPSAAPPLPSVAAPVAASPVSASMSVSGSEARPAAPSPRSDTSATATAARSPSLPRSSHNALGLGPNKLIVEAGGPAAGALAWALDLARCLRTRNYARLDALTRREAYAAFVLPSHPHPQSNYLQHTPREKQRESECDLARGKGRGKGDSDDAPVFATGPDADAEADTNMDAEGATLTASSEDSLALEALGTLVDALVDKARGTTWAVLRSAYREVSLRAVPQAEMDWRNGTDTGMGDGVKPGTTGDWLARSLVLPVGMAERWLDERRARGEVRRREGEGTDGRWVLVKA